MINTKQYLNKKAKGLTSIVKAGNSFAIYTKRWNVEDGKPLPEEVIGFTLQELIDRKTILQTEIDDINIVIAEIKLL